MVLVVCEISEGLRSSEATAVITDFDGRRQFIPVDREFLSEINGKWYMPIGFLRVDKDHKAALIQLPVEADSGANRFWVELGNIHQSQETPA
jgi:hypothetical protein